MRMLMNEPRPWTAKHPRRGAVSSFGISGTNAHVIFEEPPVSAPVAHASVSLPLPLLLSARSQAALAGQARRLHDHLADDSLALADVANTLANFRTHFEWRAAIVTSERSVARAALDALADDHDHARCSAATRVTDSSSR